MKFRMSQKSQKNKELTEHVIGILFVIFPDFSAGFPRR